MSYSENITVQSSYTKNNTSDFTKDFIKDKDFTKDCTEDFTKDFTEDFTKDCTDDFTKDFTKDFTEGFTKDFTEGFTKDFTEGCTEKHNEKYKKNIKKNMGKCEIYFKMNKWDLETDYPVIIEYLASCILDDFIVYLLDNLKFRKSDDLMICIDDLCILEDISYECNCSYKDHNDEFKNIQTICLIETIIELVNIIKNIFRIWIADINRILLDNNFSIRMKMIISGGKDKKANFFTTSTYINDTIDFLLGKIIVGVRREHPILIVGSVLKNKYIIDSLINVSKYSTVIKVKNIEDNNYYAIKINTDELYTEYIMKNELKKMKLITSNMECTEDMKYTKDTYNLSPLIEYFSLSESGNNGKKYEHDVICIVTKLFGPDMYEYSLIMRGEITLEFVRKMVLNLVRALKFIHSKNLIHNDIKLENVVLTNPILDNIIENIVDYEVTLIDYGLVTKNKSYDKRQKINGTPAYISPEELSDTGHSMKSDVWGLGILILEIISRIEIFGADMLENMAQIECMLGHKFTSIHKDVGNMAKLDIARKRFFNKNNMSEIQIDTDYIHNIVKKYMDDADLADFISCCLKLEQDRWTSEELYNHIFIKQNVEEVDRTICL